MKEINLVVLSPTGGTKKAADTVVKTIAPTVKEFDLSRPDIKPTSFNSSDTVLFAVPAFGGRVPAIVKERLKGFKGNEATAVAMVTYGNRAFEDSLLELWDLTKSLGFSPIAGIVSVAQHSMLPKLAKGKPNAEDIIELKEFAAKIQQKLIANDTSQPAIPGNYPYRDWTPSKNIIQTSGACTLCGTCAESCPVNAIPLDEPNTTDSEKCISCMRCIAICPENARALAKEAQQGIEKFLSPYIETKNDNLLFV